MLVCNRRKESDFFLLDVYCTDEHTDNIADALTHSLWRLLPEELRIFISGQCINSGGGGTNFGVGQSSTGERYFW